MSINYYNILKRHIVTAKTIKLAKDGRCAVFEVFFNANKHTILKAVEFLFNVKVKVINIVNVKKSITKKSKVKIFRKVLISKKAIIYLQENFSFNFSQFN